MSLLADLYTPDWRPPSEFPRLEGADLIGLDVETKDPRLTTDGPGTFRGGSHLVGISVAVPGRAWYFPMRHEGGGNMDPDLVLRWARAELKGNQPKVGANLLYDLECLRAEGVTVGGPKIDVLWAEAMLDENARKYDLNSVLQRRLGLEKKKDELAEYVRAAFGHRGDPRAVIWQCPAAAVGKYGEADALLPLRLWEVQREALEAEGMIELYNLECRLIPLLLDMRFQGVRVDLDKAAQVAAEMNRRRDGALLDLKTLTGLQVDVWANASLGAAADKIGLRYKHTPTGKPSFTAEWLEQTDSRFTQLVLRARKFDKASSTFIQSYILEKAVDGVLHTMFHPLRSDDGGTVTGRFSSSNPNLQNIPAKDDELKMLVRSLFIPREGQWRRFDASQIEYRLLAHYARGVGAAEAREAYQKDPTTDYHEMVRLAILDQTGIDLGRKPTKNINFGLVYGMGKPHLIRSLGVTAEEGERFFSAYHSGAPYIKATYEKAEQTARSRGYITTLLGRRRRFEQWQARDWNVAQDEGAMTHEEATARYGARIVRAYTHKALNAALQGGAADIVKKAMVDIYEAGLPVPLLTVHDELDFEGGNEEQWKEVRHILENCVKLRVPLLWDEDIGYTWADCS